jgi:hypothetical protein
MPQGQPGVIEHHARSGKLHNFPDSFFLWLGKTGGQTVPTRGFVPEMTTEPEPSFRVVQQFPAICTDGILPAVNFPAINPDHGFDGQILPSDFF